MKLYYTTPAALPEQALPIGNGSLGAMVWGGIQREHLGLNEESLWSGYYHDKNNPNAVQSLEEVRRLALNGQYSAAEKLVEKTMLGEYNESYLPLGDLYFDFSHGETVQDYKRILDIQRAVAKVSYIADGNHYHREYFVSYPAKALFITLCCDKPAMNFSICYDSKIQFFADYTEKAVRIHGQCPEHVDPSYRGNIPDAIIQGDKGMPYRAALELLSCDGVVTTEADSLHIKDAACVVLVFWAVKEPVCDFTKGYEAIKEEHISDYSALFDKVELYLGEQNELPTDQRLENLRKGEKDNGSFALYFQYGRYLLISASRAGSLAANLQGIWNWEVRPPWSSNWTTNINTQMNYWLAQSCHLQECMEPYFDLLKKLCEEGKKTARIHYNCKGFVHHHNADYWCNTNPVGLFAGESEGKAGSAAWAMWPMGGAWLCSELFRHYEYNLDEGFLRDTAYPILRECSLFLLDWMFEHNGQYVTCPSTSPENRFKTAEGTSSIAVSCAMDLELIRDVFGDFQKTCRILGINDEILPEIAERLAKLAPFQIGSKGQLLEWNEEFEECEPGQRHISHLYGLFPSELFAGNEALSEASKKSLLLRIENGGGYTGWSCAWIINVFAILKDSENAYKFLHTLLTRSTYDNLWDAHPPFQIDGNFGGTAGIANMLVQDRNGEVTLLPALPKEFESGYVKGLRIKNGKTVDIAWENGKITDSRI